MTDVFHDHLDVCKQCRDQPFNLCQLGAALLQTAAQIPQPMVKSVCLCCASSVRLTAADAVQERTLAVEGRVIAAERDDVDQSTIEWLRATARELRRVEEELRGVGERCSECDGFGKIYDPADASAPVPCIACNSTGHRCRSSK